jgi:hypothetical protein
MEICPSTAKAGPVSITCVRANARCGELARTLRKKRTSGAKALIAAASCGMAKAVP